MTEPQKSSPHAERPKRKSHARALQRNRALQYELLDDRRVLSATVVPAMAETGQTVLHNSVRSPAALVSSSAITLQGPPIVTAATTTENTQTTSGLVITSNTADTSAVTNFQITNIVGGTLFRNDGTTQIINSAFITVAQGEAGLKFTPQHNSAVSGSFTVQESTSASVAGLGGKTASGTISMTTFVQALYQDVLNRSPDPGGFAHYTNLLAHGTRPSAIVADFWQSAEHFGIEIDGYYQTFLHRAADPTGRQAWVADMVGGMSEETVISAFLNSIEFQLDNPTATQFVTALYQEVLDRAPDQSGLSGWVAVLTAQSVTPSQVIDAFINSTERHLKLVDSFYNDFFHRTPDSVGQMTWVTKLDQGTVDGQDVAKAFLSSQEFIDDNPIPL